MRIKSIALILTAIILLFPAVVVISNWNRHLLVLSNGDVIEARRTWEVLGEVFYETKDGNMESVSTEAVEKLAHGGFSGFDDWMLLLNHALKARQGIFGWVMNKIAWLVCLGFIAIGGAVFCYQFWRKKIGQREKSDQEENLTIVPIAPDLPDEEKLLLFFLNIYLLQCQAKETDGWRYRPTDGKGPLNTAVYELCANIDGQWKTRRISLGRIGGDSGARSKCYYVIFDDHLVVKLPPEPNADFNVYLESIRADKRIAGILAPRECLVPKLSLVLDKIPSFGKHLEAVRGADDNNCMEVLKAHPNYRDVFRIGGSYAYFMDLAKYFFLSQILKECHDAGDAVEKELNTYLELIWDPQAFAGRYGEEASDFCFDLQKLFHLFTKQLNNDLIPDFQKKSWFAALFMEEGGPGDTPKIPVETAKVLALIRRRHTGVVEAYKKLLAKSAREQLVKKNALKIQNIGSRLLELLALLFSRNISVRDLKPDNLLVAGDPANYPNFLLSAAAFEIGLIDVEMAAYVGAENRYMEQPKIGGTPAYATPAQLLVNEVLLELYDDLSHIYKLQDWYAMVAMIYETVTGEKLFEETACVMVSIGRELPRHFGDREKLIQFAKTASLQFWASATREFEGKVREHQDILRAVNVELFDNVKNMFKKAAGKSEDDGIRGRLERLGSRVAVNELLDCMFGHIREIMAKTRWREPMRPGRPQPLAPDGSCDATVVISA